MDIHPFNVLGTYAPILGLWWAYENVFCLSAVYVKIYVSLAFIAHQLSSPDGADYTRVHIQLDLESWYLLT